MPETQPFTPTQAENVIPSNPVSSDASIRALYRRLDECMTADARRLHARIKGLQRQLRHHPRDGSSIPSPSNHATSGATSKTTAPPSPLSTSTPDSPSPLTSEPAPEPTQQPPTPGDTRSSLQRAIADIVNQIDRSAARVTARRRALPTITYPQELPVAARREDILNAIAENQVTIIAGATGSGKTTQIPKMLLELGLGSRGWIGHTQPRRIAARSVATRIAQELNTRLGETVGYKVRFTDQTSERSLIKLMTDGVLLAETQHDRYLTRYDAIIIDEAHERSLNIDFLLGYLRQLLPRRQDLKVIITSATIDPESFASHFALPGKPRPPVIEVSGRTYPVEIRYRPLEAQHEDEEDRDLEQAILHAVDELSEPSPEAPGAANGDILIFLPGEREIRETADALGKHPLKPAHKVDIIPLYARLSNDEQQRVFERVPGRRKIILATNVAETSLTVPGIVSVIDSGIARISRYSPRIKVQRLPIEPISRASANQRAGRCGRTEPGVCIRLYSEDNFNARPEFTDPEILRTNLASVILQMAALDLGDIEDFPFLQPPDSRTVRDGYDTLLEIHALESGGLRNTLTDIGRTLARLPIDPRIGRMLLAADTQKCLKEVLVIAAALSTQDVRERPMDKAEQADTAHALFREEGSDFLGILKLWREMHKQQDHLSQNQFRKWCKSNFLSYMRFREWHDTFVQLRELMHDLGYKDNQRPAHVDSIHKALLTGLLSNIGKRTDKGTRDQQSADGDYDGARGLKFSIHPGSTLFKQTPKWVMAAEIVKTTRTYARSAANINPLWIEPLASHLVKRVYHDPHWNADLAQACAFETITLYGLEIVKRRRVDYTNIDPALSRTLFIQHALVDGQYLSNAKFFEHNHTLTNRVKEMEERTRSHDLLADQTSRYTFYDKRVPKEVASGPQFESWRKRAEPREPKMLMMERADVLAPGKVEPAPEQFPDQVRIAGKDYLLEYTHKPGDRLDGVTITVRIDDLPSLPAPRLDWLVPGMIREKVETLVRELPKGIRTRFVPVPQTIDAALAKMTFADGDLLDALTRALREVSGVFVERQYWKPDVLPDYLKMNIRVLGPRNGKDEVLLMGRDLGQIRRVLTGNERQTALRIPTGEYHRPGVLLWDFGALPERIRMKLDDRDTELCPALVDERDRESASLRLFLTQSESLAAHALGLRKLFAVQTRRECRSLISTMPGVESLRLLGRVHEQTREPERFIDDLGELTAFVAWSKAAAESKRDLSMIRTREAFDAAAEAAWTHIGASGLEVFDLAKSILTLFAQVESALTAASKKPEFAAAIQDIRTQLIYLFVPSFLTQTPWPHLKQFPRYLTAILRRLDKISIPDSLGGGPSRDNRLLNDLAPHWLKLRIRVEQGTPQQRADPELVLYRWMIEEYRVALFGADQRTLITVSAKRLEQQWAKVVAKDQG
jgi:ATP-dependent helicase HrpA